MLATVAAGLAQQTEMLQRAAALRGKSIEVVGSVHPQAMAALSIALCAAVQASASEHRVTTVGAFLHGTSANC